MEVINTMNGNRLSGKSAIVTGAASGLGYGIARRFVAEGARVVITDIDNEALKRWARYWVSFTGLFRPT